MQPTLIQSFEPRAARGATPDDYFQGLNDAPPEQAIPGYIGTALVAGLAAYTAYEAVSATISASASVALDQHFA